jgi:hypothetical protein
VSKEIDKAIEDALEGRASHEKCIDLLAKAMSCGCEKCKDYVKTFEEWCGDADTHIDWVAKYENILACLKAARDRT